MTDHKFTDEIIKALVRCTSIHTSTTCLECPYSYRERAVIHFGEDFCKDALLKQSLALINRQNAKIESLQGALERANYYGLKADEEVEHLKVELDAMRGAANSYKMHYEEVQAEIERLKELAAEKQNLTEQWQNKAGELLAEKQIIKSEAIKDFAERLTSKLNCVPQHHFMLAQVLWDIDTLVKEMAEK